VETTELVVEDVVVPDDRLVGGVPGRGFSQIMNSLEIGRIAVAAGAVGLARSALWHAVDYAKGRSAFGRPISEFQGLRFELADVATKIAAARQLTLACAELKEQGGRYDYETSMAKLFASEVAAEAALQAVRTLGGAGYIKDYDVERLYRDAPLYVVGEGSNGVLKDLIGKRLFDASSSLSWL
jgi:alkylation response protein AidB-like acyl-CoA dehydrogenase